VRVDKSALGEYVRAMRDKEGLSQEALAQKLNLSRDSVGRLERGERHVALSHRELERIASALKHVELAELERLQNASHDADPLFGDGEPTQARVWPRLPHAITSAITRSRLCVDIWQTWIPSDLHFVEALAKASLAGAKVRLLLVDPSSPVAARRAETLGFSRPERYVVSHMERFVSELETIPDFDVAASLRLSNDLPHMQMYRADDRMLAGWYFPRPSTVMPQVEVRDRSPLFVEALECFESAWDGLARPDLLRFQT
jgi:transcriptional regulator with XRE-family HTH domain